VLSSAPQELQFNRVKIQSFYYLNALFIQFKSALSNSRQITADMAVFVR